MGKSLNRTVLFLVLLLLLTPYSVVVSPALFSANVVENSWVAKAPLKEARGGLGVAVVNGKIYAIGGWSNNLLSAANEEYDPATDTWTFKKPMPTPRAGFGVGVYQNKIYCIGGYLNNSETNINEVYDPQTDTWETKEPMPTARHWTKANVVDGKIYLIDGVTLDVWTYQTANEMYDPATDSWTIKAPMPIGTVALSAAVDNKICMINAELNQVYDTKTDTWHNGSAPPLGLESVGFGGAAATSGINAPKRIYVFGEQSQLQIYDVRNDTWTVGSSIPTKRYSFGVTVLNDKLYVIGGHMLSFYDYQTTIVLNSSATNEQYTPFGYGTPDPSYVPTNEDNPPETVSRQEPFPTSLIAVIAGVSVVVVASIALIYYRSSKRNR